MKLTFLVILFVSLGYTSLADSIIVSGNVSGNWDADTVFVEDDIAIPMGDSLLIKPGAQILFMGSYSLYVRGYIRAIGEANKLISFDVLDTTGFSIDSLNKGGWNGIQFYLNSYTSDSSILAFCKFTHGKALSADSLENHGGAICIRQSDRIRISRCTFVNNFASLNGGAIYIDDSPVHIKYCDLYDNRCGPAIFPWGYGGAICSDNGVSLILNNNFAGNSSTGVGGAVAIRFHDATVNNNIFTGNISAIGGAIGYLHYYEYPFTQCNNLMYDNYAEFFGGAIASLDAGPTFVNNTVGGNYSTYGGALYVKDSLIPVLYNCILYNNSAVVGSEVYLWDAFASADFYFCDIEGGIEAFGGSGGVGYQGNYENNIDDNPLFSGTYNYYLQDGSPCINTGTPDTLGLKLPLHDLDGNPRIDPLFNCIDMGCYEMVYVDISEQETELLSNILIYPNPASDHITIRCRIADAGCRILIFDESGRFMDAVQIIDGHSESNLDVSAYSPGLYFLHIHGNDGALLQQKLIIN